MSFWPAEDFPSQFYVQHIAGVLPNQANTLTNTGFIHWSTITQKRAVDGNILHFHYIYFYVLTVHKSLRIHIHFLTDKTHIRDSKTEKNVPILKEKNIFRLFVVLSGLPFNDWHFTQ